MNRTARMIPTALLVALVLFTGSFSKLPTSKCHCNDAQKKAQQYCPFGELRSIAASTNVLADLELALTLVLTPALAPRLESSLRGYELALAASARSPPRA